MRRIMSRVLTLLLIIIAGIGIFLAIYNNSRQPKSTAVVPKILPKTTSTTIIIPQKSSKHYLFVPYWTFGKTIDSDGFDSVIYFGVGVNNNGIELNDKGYENLPKFVYETPKKAEKILAVRMVDKTINADIIKNKSLEENIATSSVSFAKNYGFNAILLDYETSAFGFDSTIRSITDFYTVFAKKTHEANLKFYVTMFGDTYFRARAYDAVKIGKLADKVFIMAYDFHKSKGNPGPNFPLYGKEEYGYDFSKMIEDFQKDISNDKIVVTLGYFGYDWRVDKTGSSIADGVPLSTNAITKEFITKCEFKKCNFSRLPNTNEPSIKYTDDNKEDHIIWFEDEISVSKKKEFLKTKGILEVAFWAYSYF